MLFTEPPRTPYDLQFSILGIPVRVHPFFWIFMIIPVADSRRVDLIAIMCWLVAVFVSILVHELGHALTARYYGARPWITLHGFGGLAAYRPADMRRDVDPTLRDSLILLAGPGAGFLLAGAIIAVLVGLGYQVGVQGFFVQLDERLFDRSPYLVRLISGFLFVNLAWGVLNLLPIIPLDGGQLLRVLLARINGVIGEQQAIMTSMFVAAAAAVYALVSLRMMILAIFMAFLAVQSYQLWQATGYRRW